MGHFVAHHDSAVAAGWLLLVEEGFGNDYVEDSIGDVVRHGNVVGGGFGVDFGGVAGVCVAWSVGVDVGDD